MRKMPRQSGLALITTLSLVAVVLCAGISGYFAKAYVPEPILQAIFKYLTGVVAVTWLFSFSIYGKLADITDAPGLDYNQHRRLEQIVRTKIRSFWINAVGLAFIAALLNLPTVLQEAKVSIHSLVYSLTFTAFSLCILLLVNSWLQLEEIRQLRSKLKEDQRREELRNEQLKNIAPSSEKAWESDSKLDGFRNNRPE